MKSCQKSAKGEIGGQVGTSGPRVIHCWRPDRGWTGKGSTSGSNLISSDEGERCIYGLGGRGGEGAGKAEVNR